MHLKGFVLLSLTFLVLLVSARIIQVPYISSDETLYLRLEELEHKDTVFNIFGDLQRIYSKEVYQIVDGKEVSFPVCYQQPPEVNFQVFSELVIGGKHKTYGEVVYDFNQIKFPRNLIDIDTYNNKIYFVREDGVLVIATLSSDLKTIEVSKQITTEEKNIAMGNIVILPNATNGNKVGYGLLLTKNQAVVFDLNGDNFQAISNLNQMRGFESAIAVQGNYVAAAFGQDGAKIFSIDFIKNQFKLEASFDKSNLKLKNVNIKDLTYNPSKKIVFLLDHNEGIVPIQLTIEGSSLTAVQKYQTINYGFCNVIYYDSFNDELYINCRQLHKFWIKNWPQFTEKVLPKQEISIRQITSNNGSVVLVGRNIFEFISEERKAAVYNDRLLDKLIIKNNFFISGNQNYLLAGKYSVTPPKVVCSTTDQSLVGKHKVLFKVTAQCNSAYFTEIQFQPGPTSNNDKCVYSVYHTLKIWKAKSLNVNFFMIFGLVIASIGFLILLWWGCSYLNLRKLRHHLKNYQTLEEDQMGQTSKEQPGNQMADMKPVSEDKDNKEGRHQLNQEVEAPENLHDIE